jgi:ketosteroid isomerase-like protein
MTSAEDRIETVRLALEGLSRGDPELAVSMAHPDIEVVRTGGLPPVKGLAAFRKWLEPDAFDQMIYEDLDFTVSGDQILAKQRIRARGAGSGIEMEIDSWAVFTFDDDLVIRADVFLEHEEAAARTAAGLDD